MRVKDAEQDFTKYKQDQRQVYQDAVDAAKHKTAALETKVKEAENAASERAKENKILVDIPDMSRVEWNPATLNFDPK